VVRRARWRLPYLHQRLPPGSEPSRLLVCRELGWGGVGSKYMAVQQGTFSTAFCVFSLGVRTERALRVGDMLCVGIVICARGAVLFCLWLWCRVHGASRGQNTVTGAGHMPFGLF